MKIHSVDATAFGALRGERLEFADGLTVVWGPNEAAKSTWHAAIHAAVSGRRRRTDATDKDFAERHRPWDGDEWSVGAELVLTDGRRVAIQRDLGGRRTDVVDADLGRSLEDEITWQGVPDAARWMGLDRRTFAATALVRQTELVIATDDVDPLRALLQRAASTLGGGTTAAEAITTISNFRRDQVGVDRSNAVKPLRLAVIAEREASELLAQRQDRQREYLSVLSHRDLARQAIVLADQRLVEVRRGRHRSELRRLVDDHARAERLLEQIPEVAETDLDDELIDELERLVSRATALPDAGPLVDDEISVLAARIDALPAALDGPHEEDPALTATIDDWRQARRHRVELDERLGSTDVDAIDDDARRLDDVSDAMSVLAAGPPVDGGAAAELAACRQLRLDLERRRRRSQWMLGAAVVALAAAVVLAVSGAVPVALIVGAVGLISGVWSWREGSATRGLSNLDDEIASWSERVDQHAEAVAFAERRRHLAAGVVEAAGLAPSATPAELAVQVEGARAALNERLATVARRDAARVHERSAAARVLHGVETAGQRVETTDDLESAVRSMRAEFQRRRGVVIARAELPALVAQLDARRAAVTRARDVADQRRSIESALREALTTSGHLTDARSSGSSADGGSFDLMVESARVVVADARRARHLRVEHERHRAALDRHLDGRSLADLAASAATATMELAADPGPEYAEVDEHRASGELATAQQTEAGLRGRLEAIDPADVDVAGAEAAVADAERELERVHRLATVLDRTAEYLAAAQEQAFRVVAPRLAEVVSAHLPAVTGGRYRDAAVDPETLQVTVRDEGGRFRVASSLSHGTMEQVYLLLRLAMSRVLTSPDEVCPFVLDDATVHADADRTFAILSVLREAADDQQVIVFTQEPSVREWATTHLGSADRLVDLTEVA